MHCVQSIASSRNSMQRRQQRVCVCVCKAAIERAIQYAKKIIIIYNIPDATDPDAVAVEAEVTRELLLLLLKAFSIADSRCDSEVKPIAERGTAVTVGTALAVVVVAIAPEEVSVVAVLVAEEGVAICSILQECEAAEG